FFSYCYVAHLLLLSFPTRRSSDLHFDIAVLNLFPFLVRATGNNLHTCISLISTDKVTLVITDMVSRSLIPIKNKSSLHCFNGISSRSEEHTSELQSRFDLVCRLLLEKKKRNMCIIC